MKKKLKPVFKGLPFPRLPVIVVDGVEVFEGIGYTMVEEGLAFLESFKASRAHLASRVARARHLEHVSQMELQSANYSRCPGPDQSIEVVRPLEGRHQRFRQGELVLGSQFGKQGNKDKEYPFSEKGQGHGVRGAPDPEPLACPS